MYAHVHALPSPIRERLEREHVGHPPEIGGIHEHMRMNHPRVAGGGGSLGLEEEGVCPARVDRVNRLGFVQHR